jgi:hypothetical protein
MRAWFVPGTPESRLRFVALVFYVLLWMLILVVAKIVESTLH